MSTTDLWINVRETRRVPIINSVQGSTQAGNVFVRIHDFLKQFGHKLGELYCISNIQAYPENIVIYQGVPGYLEPPPPLAHGTRV